MNRCKTVLLVFALALLGVVSSTAQASASTTSATTLALANQAPAVTAQASPRIVATVWGNAGFTGYVVDLKVIDKGDCNSSGYLVEIPRPRGGVGVSSISSDHSPRCNYVIMYSHSFWGTVSECGEGFLDMAYVGGACNDRVWTVRVVYRYRAGHNSLPKN